MIFKINFSKDLLQKIIMFIFVATQTDIPCGSKEKQV